MISTLLRIRRFFGLPGGRRVLGGRTIVASESLPSSSSSENAVEWEREWERGGGGGRIELQGRCKVNGVRMNDGAGIAPCKRVNRKVWFNIVLDEFGLAKEDGKGVSTRKSL